MNFCRVPRNTDKEIQAVYASNKEESKLYKDLVNLFPNKELALIEYAKVFTGEFKSWFANSKSIDSNNEPVILYDSANRPYYVSEANKRYYIKKEDRLKQPIEEYSQGAKDVLINKDISRAKREDLNDYETFNRIKDIIEYNKDYSLNNTDSNDTFYENKTVTGSKLKRLTEWVTEHLSSDSKKKAFGNKTAEEWAALKYYEKKTTSITDNVLWEDDGKLHSFEEIKEFFKQKNKISTSYGTIIHLLIQRKLTDDKALDKEITKAIEDSGIEEWKFQWLNDIYLSELLYDYLNLNLGETYKGTGVEDKIASEVTVGSEILGIGTKVDGIIEHANGSISLIDFKTGQYFLSDAGTSDEMKYGNLIDEVIKDSKLDKAKMELVLRALMIKEQNADIKFRNIQIAHIGVNQTPRIYDASIKNYLTVLSEYFKNNDKTKYDLLNDKKLFNYEQYTSEIKELAENEEDKFLSTEEKILKYQNELFRLQTLSKIQKKNPEVGERISELTNMIHDLTKSFKADFKADNTDTGIIEQWFGTFYENANPIAQNFLRLFQKNKFNALKEINRFKDLQQVKLRPVIEEYYKKHPTKRLANKGIAGGIVYHDNDNSSGLFDFMWEKKTSGEREGYYARVITEDDVKNNRYTQSQFEYNKWYRENLRNLYDSTMKEKIGNSTKEQLTMDQSFRLDNTFMPRIPMDGKDIVERYGFFSKENLTQQIKSQTDYFIKEQYRTQKREGVGQPVRYIGSPGIISSGYHSFNAEDAILRFATNMIYKKHLDGVSALGQGTLQLLKDELDPQTAKEKYPGTYNFLDKYIKQHVDGKNDEVSAFRKPLTLDINGKKYEVNPARVMDGANNLVTASTMWLNIPGGTFNSFLNLMFSSKEALKGSLSKLVGVDVSDIDYTISDFFKAVAIWFKSGILVNFKGNAIEDYATAAHKDKLHRFMRMMDFDTNSFKYGNNKGDLLSAKNRLLSKSTMYMFHSIGEEFALMTTLSASLIRMKLRDGANNYIDLKGNKVNEKDSVSMWDAYTIDENTGEFVYTGPQRGTLKTGEALLGLTADEINKFRRYSQRVYGGYREDERTAAEQYALGRWVLKFKKFIPALITNNFQRKFNDWSIGKYEQLYDVNGQPIFADGQPVVDWVTQVNEGRVWVTLKFLTFGLASRFKDNPDWNSYKWENLSSDQQKQIVDMGTATLVMLSMIAAGRFIFPDEEDKKLKIYKRYYRLVDDIIQINPIDIGRNFASPLLQTQMAFKTGEALTKYMFNGVILGERLKTGPNKGNLPGSTLLKQRIPFISIPNQFGVFDDEDPEKHLGILESR